LNFTVYVALFGWPLVAICLCAALPPRRAVITAFIAAWLFLPMASFPIPGLPDWTKMTATCISLLLGLLIFDFHRLISFRPEWVDAPILMWCLCPIPSSLMNDLGLYDGLSTSLGAIVTWGLPFFIGRIFLKDIDGLRELAIGIFLGGLVYIPLCLFELRMSPQLHLIVYGYTYQGYEHSHRFGGWRPSVFMEHGLMVGMWMCMASLVGVWLWISGALRSIYGIAMPWMIVPLMATAILCKSTGAVILMATGLVLFFLSRRYRTPKPFYLIALVAPLYILLRVTGLWSGAALVEAASAVSEERAASLRTRMIQEDQLSARALQRPIFGWGGWGRQRVRDESGSDVSITDGLWILEFGARGLVGVAGMLATLLVPLFVLARTLPPHEWTRGAAAPAAALTLVVLLYLLDCIANAMITPIYLLAAGGIAGLKPYAPPEREPEAFSGS